MDTEMNQNLIENTYPSNLLQNDKFCMYHQSFGHSHGHGHGHGQFIRYFFCDLDLLKSSKAVTRKSRYYDTEAKSGLRRLTA